MQPFIIHNQSTYSKQATDKGLIAMIMTDIYDSANITAYLIFILPVMDLIQIIGILKLYSFLQPNTAKKNPLYFYIFPATIKGGNLIPQLTSNIVHDSHH